MIVTQTLYDDKDDAKDLPDIYVLFSYDWSTSFMMMYCLQFPISSRTSNDETADRQITLGQPNKTSL